MVWETKPTMEKEKWRPFLSFVLLLKALGYFLLPSSFFPDQEFTTPHGFLRGEEGESEDLAARLPSHLNCEAEGPGVCVWGSPVPSLPSITGGTLTHLENIFLKKGGGEPMCVCHPPPGKERVHVRERVCVCMCVCPSLQWGTRGRGESGEHHLNVLHFSKTAINFLLSWNTQVTCVSIVLTTWPSSLFLLSLSKRNVPLWAFCMYKYNRNDSRAWAYGACQAALRDRKRLLPTVHSLPMSYAPRKEVFTPHLLYNTRYSSLPRQKSPSPRPRIIKPA